MSQEGDEFCDQTPYTVPASPPTGFTLIGALNRNKTNYKSSLGMGIGVASDDQRQIDPNITPVPPPSVKEAKELVETHQSRFN